MRKFYLLGLVLLGVLAFSAVAAGSAFAESEFLLNNVAAKAGDVLGAEGELELTDSKVPFIGTVTVLCSGKLDGKLTSASEGEVTEVLNLSGEKLTELSAPTILGETCTTITGLCGEALLYPEKLPWLFKIELDGGTTFLLDLGTLKEAAYELECMGTGGITDLCEGLTTFLLSNSANDVLAVKTATEVTEEETALELGTCSQGGANAGSVTNQGETLIFDEPPTGNTLQVS